MAEHIEVAGASHTEAVERFAEVWWDDRSGEAGSSLPPAERVSPLVIRAERASS